MATSMPGPRDLFFGLSFLPAIRRDLLGWFQGLQQAHGDCVGLRLGGERYHSLFHPDQIREVLITKAASFRIAARLRRVLAQWNGRGLITSEGDEWRTQRRRIQTAFTHDRLRDHAAAMVAATEKRVAAWPGTTIDVNDAMTDLTLEIIARTMFDTEVTGDTRPLGEAVATLSEVAMLEIGEPFLLPDWLPLPRIRRKLRAIRVLDETVWRFIRERRAVAERPKGATRPRPGSEGARSAPTTEGPGKDLLSRLLTAVDEEEGQGGMTEQQARDECVTMLLAGHDTVAVGLLWATQALARFPDQQQRAHEEAARVLGDRPAQLDDVAKLEHVERVVKEALRLWPPAIGVFAREAVEDVEIGGYLVPAGGLVQPVSFVTHRDPRWFPEPERFDPDRFAPGRVESIPKLAYFPFGAGPRMCIGMGFAMVEMVLVLATLLRSVWFEPTDPSEPELSLKISLRPLRPISVRVVRR